MIGNLPVVPGGDPVRLRACEQAGKPPQSSVSAHPSTMGREEERFGKTRDGLTFDDLLRGWVSEKQPREKTRDGATNCALTVAARLRASGAQEPVTKVVVPH